MSADAVVTDTAEHAGFAGDRLKVLISAFYCGPGKGSEQGNGWNWVMQAARDHEVYVLTCPESKELIESSRDQWEPKGIKFIFWSVPGWPLRLIDPFGPFRFLVLIYYVFWQITVFPLALSLHLRNSFDLVHHVTFNTVEVPGFLWLLRTAFVWGPVGGAQLPPRSFRRHFGWGWIGEEFRILRKHLVPLNPIVRLALRKARAVLVANSETEQLLRRCGKNQLIREIDVGVNLAAITPPQRHAQHDRLVVLWAGLLIPRKGPLLALESIAEARRRGLNVELLMAGDGPMRGAVDQRISDLGLRGAVERVGALSFQEMNAFYAQGDVFLFSSLHDTSGTVVLEAMAHGLPIIALDHQGAADMVDELSGIKVPVSTVSATVDAIVDAMLALHQNPELAGQLGRAARARVEQFYDWNRRSSVLRTIYSAASAGSRLRSSSTTAGVR